MAMKKAVQARVAARKQAVGRMRAKGVDAATARKRNYVRTRAAELEAQGKTVDRAALRKKFESGQVSRAGFYKPGEKAALRKKSAGTKSSGSKITATKSGVGDAKDRIKKARPNVGDAKDRIGKPMYGSSTVPTKNKSGTRRDVGGRGRSYARYNQNTLRKVKRGEMTSDEGRKEIAGRKTRYRQGTRRDI